MKVLLIDNYDSFTYNLEHLLVRAGAGVVTRRNDEDFLPEIKAGVYDAVVIGPGPGSPEDPAYFGKCTTVITEYGTKGLPIFGVCLGFQGIACAFGAKLKRALLPMHGKLSGLAVLQREGVLQNISDGTEVMRYHSLMVDADSLAEASVVVTSEVEATSPSITANGREVMSIKHSSYPIHGVQFHPESFATESGELMMRNFLNMYKK